MPTAAVAAPSVSGNQAVLASWRQLLDLGTLQAGEANLAGTARASVARISAGRATELGVANGDLVQVSNSRGAITVPVEISDIDNACVWLARNSEGSQAIATLGSVSGDVVTVVKA